MSQFENKYVDEYLAGLSTFEGLIIGSRFDDHIKAFLSNDLVFGRGGNDQIDGNEGDDLLSGGKGHDEISGGAGDDTLLGGKGNDILVGDTGDDFVFGGKGHDTMIWNNGDGSDTIFGGAGFDRQQVNGATELGDEFEISNSGRLVEFERTNLGNFKLEIRKTEVLEVNGGGGDDTISVIGDVQNRIELDLDGGTDTNGHVANAHTGDTLDLSQLNEGVSVDLDINFAGIAAPGLSQQGLVQNIGVLNGEEETFAIIADDFENVIGTEFDDRLFGNAEANVLQGLGGDDVFHAFGGNDIYDGGHGTDTALFNQAVVGIVANLAEGQVTAGDDVNTLISIENLNGGNFDDRITGDDGANVLNGNGGDDTIHGGGGDDVLNGGDGHDRIRGGDGDDLIAGGAGADNIDGQRGLDTVDFSASDAAVHVNLEDGTFAGGHAEGDRARGVDGIIGSDFDDTLIGFDQQRSGRDAFTNVIDGGDGNDVIDGRGANDTLDGGAGDDVIRGGAGENDIMTGGTGHDSFLFVNGDGNGTGGNADQIQDFTVGDDVFALEAESFGLGAHEDVVFANVARLEDGVDPNGIDNSLDLGTFDPEANVYVLQGAFANAGAAATAIAEARDASAAEIAHEDEAGFFVYFNQGQGRARLFAVNDLNAGVDEGIQQVANLGDLVALGEGETNADSGARTAALDLLETFTADEFTFDTDSLLA